MSQFKGTLVGAYRVDDLQKRQKNRVKKVLTGWGWERPVSPNLLNRKWSLFTEAKKGHGPHLLDSLPQSSRSFQTVEFCVSEIYSLKPPSIPLSEHLKRVSRWSIFTGAWEPQALEECVI